MDDKNAQIPLAAFARHNSITAVYKQLHPETCKVTEHTRHRWHDVV